jgi:two-component sensor histidine kinase
MADEPRSGREEEVDMSPGEPSRRHPIALSEDADGRAFRSELQHRLRNMLAMLRSVISRTSLNKTDVQEYVAHLQARIDAMARTQAMLARSSGSLVELEDIIRDELVADAAEGQRYSVSGPAVCLEAHTAEVLGLAIHELATNSVKFGALGDRCGMLDVSWSAISDGEERVRFTWRESGLDLTNMHPLPGFGSELITKRIPYELRGRGEMDFKPDGLVATIEFPLVNGCSIAANGSAGIE